jgi:hypothetical protein
MSTESLSTEFLANRYVTVEQGLHPEVAALLAQYTLFQDFQHPTAVYADPLMESLMLSLLPVVEEATGLSLYPTYACHRLYKPGDEMHPHTDRPSNEITVTVNLGSHYIHTDPGYKWGISVDGYEEQQNPGDMFIYRGTELTHWRTPFEGEKGSWHSQAFFGYVNVDGPYSFCKYDTRPNLGYPQSSSSQDHLNFAIQLMEKNKEAKTQPTEKFLFLTNE